MKRSWKENPRRKYNIRTLSWTEKKKNGRETVAGGPHWIPLKAVISPCSRILHNTMKHYFTQYILIKSKTQYSTRLPSKRRYWHSHNTEDEEGFLFSLCGKKIGTRPSIFHTSLNIAAFVYQKNSIHTVNSKDESHRERDSCCFMIQW